MAATLKKTDQVKSDNLEHIKTAFDRIYNEPFPSKGGKEVQRVDLVLLDSDIMGLVSVFLARRNYLTDDQIKMLESSLVDLKKVIPYLDNTEKQYFLSLKQLANDTIESVQNSKL